jgi:hypothetical protein
MTTPHLVGRIMTRMAARRHHGRCLHADQPTDLLLGFRCSAKRPRLCSKSKVAAAADAADAAAATTAARAGRSRTAAGGSCRLGVCVCGEQRREQNQDRAAVLIPRTGSGSGCREAWTSGACQCVMKARHCSCFPAVMYCIRSA